MDAVIFAAGLGTRLRPLTDTVPKPLIDVGGRPVLRHVLDALPSSVRTVTVVVGHLGDAIRRELGDAVRYAEQPELRGTYDALTRARPLLGDGPFLALNGDDLYARTDLERLAASEPFAMLARRLPNPNPYSHLATDGGFLTGIVQRRDAEALDAKDVYVGACLLDGRFFGLEPGRTPDGEAGLPHTLAKHLNTFPVQVLPAEFWMPVGTPEELAAARAASGHPGSVA